MSDAVCQNCGIQLNRDDVERGYCEACGAEFDFGLEVFDDKGEDAD
jgi:hypothetical protein